MNTSNPFKWSHHWAGSHWKSTQGQEEQKMSAHLESCRHGAPLQHGGWRPYRTQRHFLLKFSEVRLYWHNDNYWASMNGSAEEKKRTKERNEGKEKKRLREEDAECLLMCAPRIKARAVVFFCVCSARPSVIVFEWNILWNILNIDGLILASSFS